MNRTKGLLYLFVTCVIILAIALACVLSPGVSSALYGVGETVGGGFIGILDAILVTPLAWGAVNLAQAAVVWAIVTLVTLAVAYAVYNYGLKPAAQKIRGSPPLPQQPAYKPRGGTLDTDELPTPAAPQPKPPPVEKEVPA